MRRTMKLLSLALCLLVPALALAADGTPEPIAGLGPTGPIKKLHTGFMFTGGPAADKDGNVFFNDIPYSTAYKVDTAGNLSTFRKPSGSSNGLMFNGAGELVACEMEGRVVAVSPDGKTVRPVA